MKKLSAQWISATEVQALTDGFTSFTNELLGHTIEIHVRYLRNPSTGWSPM